MWSHDLWKHRKTVIGQEARNGSEWKVIQDVIISPNRNAYALVFSDGTMLDMSTYDDVEVR